MAPTRGSVLAGLVFVAIAAPVAAYAVSSDDPGSTPSGSGHGHHQAKPHAADPDETSEPGTEHADDSSAAGRAHADAMKAWAHCVADAASGPKSEGSQVPPKDACGDKPMPPGLAKHAAAGSGSPGRSGDHRPEHSRGHGHSNRS